jgi:biotin-dependent carboxylase-like uncharacterized protein
MIKVLSSRFGLSIQDLGRLGFYNYGVPTSGAMDMYSFQLANSLLNNAKNDAALEITFGGCKLEFQSDAIICLSGADFSAKIDYSDLHLNTVTRVKKGSILSFGKQKFGVRSYLAVQGGFQTNTVLNSRSMFNNITPKAIVAKNTILPIASQKIISKQATSRVKVDSNHFNTKTIYCFEGPEFQCLDNEQKRILKTSNFRISRNTNRMGYQLEECIKNQLPSMLTSGVIPGSVQLTPSGKLIILMRDAQVTGGYPRVLQLTEDSINKLAQKSALDSFNFKLISNA